MTPGPSAGASPQAARVAVPPASAWAALWAAAATAAAPALRLLLRRRLRRGKEIAGRIAERRGIDATPRPAGELLWLHAASVGETVSILPVLTVLATQEIGRASCRERVYLEV